MLRSFHRARIIPSSFFRAQLPSLRQFKTAPTTLTEKKKRARLEKHIHKEKEIKDSALSQKEQLLNFQELTQEMPPYVIKACFLPTMVQFMLCGTVYFSHDFFTPANTNSIVAMGHIFAQNIFVFSAAILGYETTRTAIPEHTLGQERYKAEVKLQVPQQQRGRGLLINKSGRAIVGYSVILCGLGLAAIDSLSPFATLPFLLNGFLLKFYSYRQAEFGMLPFWVLKTIKFNSMFIITQVFVLLLLILARLTWVKRMEDQKISLEVKIEEKLEGRVLSATQKQEIKSRQSKKLNELSGFTNIWK